MEQENENDRDYYGFGKGTLVSNRNGRRVCVLYWFSKGNIMNDLEYLSNATQAREAVLNLADKFGPLAVLEGINYWYRFKADSMYPPRDGKASHNALLSAKEIKIAIEYIQEINE